MSKLLKLKKNPKAHLAEIICHICGEGYYGKVSLETRPSTGFICPSCTVSKDVTGKETCLTCKHFNPAYRTASENYFFRRCSKGKVSDHADVAEDSGWEPGLVYAYDKCGDYEK